MTRLPEKEPVAATLDHEIDELVRTILRQNGTQLQAIILIEEMAELIQVLCKMQRGKFDREKLSEEFTHIKVNSEVIRRVMDIADEDVRAQVRAKLAEYAADAHTRNP